MNPDAQLRAQIDAFVADLSTLVRRAALDAVASALGSPAPGPAQRGPGRLPKAAAFAAPTKRRGKRAKRKPADVAKSGATVVAYVAKNPGQSVKQIGKALGVATKELALPTIRVIEARKLRTTGERRGTRYFVK